MTEIDDLISINDATTEWLINVSVASDESAAESMKHVVRLHNQLDRLITQLQLVDLRETTTSLKAILAREGATIALVKDRITAVAKEIRFVESVISCAAQAVAAAARIVTVLGVPVPQGL